MNQLSLSSTSSCGGIIQSLSGITKIQVADVTWIYKWPEFVSNHTIDDSIGFLGINDWLDITPIVNSADYDDSGAHKNGLIFKTRCSFDISGDNDEKSEFIDTIVRKCIVAKIHFKNGSVKIIGEFGVIPNPIVPTSSSKIGAKASDANIHTINLDWSSTHKPYFIN